MQEMQIRCDQVQAELDQANSGTKYLLERADGLRSQRSACHLFWSAYSSARKLTEVQSVCSTSVSDSRHLPQAVHPLRLRVSGIDIT